LPPLSLWKIAGFTAALLNEARLKMKSPAAEIAQSSGGNPMVRITPEEVMAMRRKPEPDELSQIDRDIMGETCRLEIPFRDVARMKQTAELLRGYADVLDFYAGRADLPPRTILFHLRSEARQINKMLRNARPTGTR
jgi:hypothetical protein